ncbi:hypothetical protein T440DRAFT_467323 [Plenodomus tracheiphilus IPT5]|uniref:Uncharacterized protein n=1 Tax=Plenodomus tracheiphilus IPT5 TaxID=1408161 RepID=A0A6A7BCK1_9PLEO|nr:hypothetical protein T440DRAFT_467323 [Plenodomus tracheiphilus IPT5]
MTGGASGWPSRDGTAIASSVRSEAHGRSLPGSWPSPALSPVKSTFVSQQSSDDSISWAVDNECHSKRIESSNRSAKSHMAHRSTRHEIEHISTKSYSTYKAPTVEDAHNTSSESASSLQQPGWGGVTYKEGDWQGDKKGSGASWNRNKKSDTNGRGASSKAASNNSWDGFEKNKTDSEVSVAGSGSEKSALSSLAPSHRGAKTSTHRSHRSGRSRASNIDFGAQTGWGGSEVSRKTWGGEKGRIDDDGWGDRGGDETSEGGCHVNGSQHGSGRRRRRRAGGSKGSANAFEEPDETYLNENENENWRGTPARVGSRQTSVAGWN